MTIFIIRQHGLKFVEDFHDIMSFLCVMYLTELMRLKRIARELHVKRTRKEIKGNRFFSESSKKVCAKINKMHSIMNNELYCYILKNVIIALRMIAVTYDHSHRCKNKIQY